ncbi:MAG: sulfurtransferase [Gammaproteobacteria bacterium RIFCSPLOWO2_02_FULL_61_13]|nr:MAG: sulfurtransferase [Gammaproteobacteria bacterium RIFCSPLOWO2_02_FULL_61_13]
MANATMKRTAQVLLVLLASMGAAALDVNISGDLEYVDVTHDGQPVRIMRNQDPQHTISERYALTSRKCPPFCIQPAVIAPGVETIAELEMLHYLKQAATGDASVLVIDSRTPDWVENGTIPGSINIPWTMLDTGAGADPFQVADILQQRFGVKNREGLWDFSAARTLVLFCNGNWCGQSPANIRTLLSLGYPPARLKWYRGGMQNWEMLGLTVVK